MLKELTKKHYGVSQIYRAVYCSSKNFVLTNHPIGHNLFFCDNLIFSNQSDTLLM